MNGYLLDTHAWLWLQSGTTFDALPDVLRALEQKQREAQLYISAISVLEIARLVASGRFDLKMPVEEFLSAATADDGLVLLELTPRILIESTRLPGDIHRDPADRLLISTARTHGLTLVTRDKDILRYAKQGHMNALKF